jgi:hydrogenase maturation protease
MILIIGYGNPLRSDDAIGQHVARVMQQRLRHTKLQVHTTYQLVPELASLISSAEIVVFIDALMGGTPGEVLHEVVAPTEGVGSLTHHVTPGSLLAAASELYGKAPRGILISIVGEAFHYGSELSPELQHRLPTIAEQVKAIIESSEQVQAYKGSNYA